MRKLAVAFLTVAVIAVPAFASGQPLFERYEAVRQALLNGNIKDIQTSAHALENTARAAKLDAMATHSSQLAAATDIRGARVTFATVSADLIGHRKVVKGDKLVVAYCSMEKKSWLQPSASPISNPYLDSSMRTCGEIVKDAPPQRPQ